MPKAKPRQLYRFMSINSGKQNLPEPSLSPARVPEIPIKGPFMVPPYSVLLFL
jgi:hypothetical protein